MKLNQWLVLAGIAAVMSLGTNQVVAQGGGGGGGRKGGGGGGGGQGGFDPAQMQQRMMDRYKEVLEFTDDAEWNAVQPLVQKVMTARQGTMGGMGRGMMGGGRNRGGGGDTQPADQGKQPRGGMFGAPNPEADALQKAIDSKASAAEIRAALEKYHASRKAKQAELEKAQADLRKVLSARREAIATLNGL